MFVTAKSHYALIFLTDLALSGDERRPLSIKEISRREAVPAKFMEQIVSVLKSSGFIRALRGPKGGYRLSQPPGRLNCRSVVEALQGPLEQVPLPQKESSPVRSGISSALREAEAAFVRTLASLTLESLADRCRLKSTATMFYI